jgi:hypothetical protein
MAGLAQDSSNADMELGAEYYNQFAVGGVSIRLTSKDDAAVTLVPALLPFQAESEASDITIRIEWLDELQPAPASPLFDSGSVWRLFEDAPGFQFDFSAPAFGSRPYKRLLVDSCFSDATLQMSEEASQACPHINPLDYPLDELLIMHRLTQQRAIELHACGIVQADGSGNLFVGHSGAGKSTTTRLWISDEEVKVLSDDRIIVRSDRSKSGSGVRMYGTPWHGEAMHASPESATLRRIFILEHGAENAIIPLSPSQAVAELFARSFVPFHRHEFVDSALDFLKELVEAVPCYRYAFEPNQSAVETVRDFCD